MVNIYFVYKKIKITIIGNHDNYPTLQDALFGAVKLTKNPDIDKCGYSGYRTRFDRRSRFSHPSGEDGQNIIILE